jgi:hypothetical protein
MQPNSVGDHSHTLNPWVSHVVKADPGGNNPYITQMPGAPGINTQGITQSNGTGLETRSNNAYVMYFIYVGPYDLTKLQVDAKTGTIKRAKIKTGSSPKRK